MVRWRPQDVSKQPAVDFVAALRPKCGSVLQVRRRGQELG